MQVNFTPFHIFGANGQQYTGIRPSLIPKPFISAVVVLNGKTFKPGLPEGYTKEQVIGYDAAVRVGLNLGITGKVLGGDNAYRLITLLNDNKKWSRLILIDGTTKDEWIK